MNSDTLPSAIRGPYIGVSCWNSAQRIIVAGGDDNSDTVIAKTRVFNATVLGYADVADRPIAGMVNAGGTDEPGTGIGVGTFSNCDILTMGTYAAHAPTAKCYRFIAAAQAWSVFPDYPGTLPSSSNRFFGAGLADGTFLGMSDNDSYLWDPADNLWHALTFPLGGFGVRQAGALLSDGRYLLVAEDDVVAGSTTLYLSIFAAGSWSVVTTVGAVAGVGTFVDSFHLVPLDAGRALLLAGFSDVGNNVITKAFLFNGTTLGAAATPTTQRKRFGSAGSFAGEAYLVGGIVSGGGFPRTTSIERYNAAAGTWGNYDVLPAALSDVCCAIAPTAARLYVVGGFTAAGNTVNTVSIYGATQAAVTCCSCPARAVTTCLVLDTRNPAAGDSGADAAGQWYEWTPVTTTPVASCMHQGIYHFLSDNGLVRKEVPGQYFDDTVTPILTRINYAPMSLAGMQGAERVYRINADGRWMGAHTMRVTAYISQGNDLNPLTWTTDIDMSTVLNMFELRPSPTNGTSLELVFEEVATANLTGGFALELISLEVGSSGRVQRVDVAQKVSG